MMPIGIPKMTLKNNQFPSLFPRQKKSENLLPGPPKNTKNRPSNHQKHMFAKTWFLQYLPYENHVLRAPTVNHSTTKSMQKVTWKQAPTKTKNSTYQNSKSSQNGLPKSAKMSKNLVLGSHVSSMIPSSVPKLTKWSPGW